jgi:uncharacterized protein (DUF1015 family)
MRRMAADRPTPVGASSPSPAGLDLAPLRGVRYATRNGADLARLTCPPYDVIDNELRSALEAADPHNVVRLILPRGDPAGPETAYRKAAGTLRRWLSSGVLAADPDPALYVYELHNGVTAVRGLIGSLRLTAPEAGVVLPHEHTMAGPVQHRVRLIEATEANLEPIFLVVEGAPGAAARAVEDAEQLPPLAQVHAPDRSTHRLWMITEPARLAEIAADLWPRRALIADGHHRYEAYLQYQAARRRAGETQGPWDRGLAFLVGTATFGVRVQAFHRVVRGLNWDEALRQVSRSFRVTPLPGGEREALPRLAHAGRDGPAFVLTNGARWALLTEPSAALAANSVPGDRSPAWRSLDVVLLHYGLLTALWNIDSSEEKIRYIASADSAVTLASESNGVAVLLNPAPLETVLAVAAAGERMPQKSTLFAPKPRTGLVLRTYTVPAGADSGPAR